MTWWQDPRLRYTVMLLCMAFCLFLVNSRANAQNINTKTSVLETVDENRQWQKNTEDAQALIGMTTINVPGEFCRYSLSGSVGQAMMTVYPTSLTMELTNAEPNMVYTIWLDYRDRDNNKALPPDFPVDAQGVAPAFALTARVKDGMGLDPNAIQTDTAGNGMITIPLDYNILAAYEGPLVHVDLDKQGANRVGGHWMRVYPKSDDVPASQVIDPSTGLPKIVRGSVRGFTVVKHPSGLSHGHTPGTKDIDHFGGFSDNMPLDCLDGPEAEVWIETFADLKDGTQEDHGDTAWTSARESGTFGVLNQQYRITGGSGLAVWKSDVIDISMLSAALLSVDIQSEGPLEEAGKYGDYLRITFSIDGQPPQDLADRIASFNNNQIETVQSDNLSGDTIQIFIEALVTSSDEFYRWDNVSILGTSDDIQSDGRNISADRLMIDAHLPE